LEPGCGANEAPPGTPDQVKLRIKSLGMTMPSCAAHLSFPAWCNDFVRNYSWPVFRLGLYTSVSLPRVPRLVKSFRLELFRAGASSWTMRIRSGTSSKNVFISNLVFVQTELFPPKARLRINKLIRDVFLLQRSCSWARLRIMRLFATCFRCNGVIPTLCASSNKYVHSQVFLLQWSYCHPRLVN
jgi:hypothetical protein